MRLYSDKISLIKNSRGVYLLDTTMGCSAGLENNPKGCYGDCYAARNARIYGYDFGQTVSRYFESHAHQNEILMAIDKMTMPFVRIGGSGDPSENWEHTLNVCRVISKRQQLNLFDVPNTEIVIITKHWKLLTDGQLSELAKYNICVNTSVSALDVDELRDKSLNEFNRLKPYCNSVLRIVSADFNLENKTGHRLAKIQAELFKNAPTIDTVLRVSLKNPLVTDGVINVKQSKFLGKKCHISKYNPKTYFGKCSTCIEMCGLNSK